MAEPSQITVSGGKFGFNGRISNTVLGRIDIRVSKITRGLVINSNESGAAQAKTFYPMYVSAGSFTLALLHKGIAERDALNEWVMRYMEQGSRNQLADGTVEVSIPGRRFVRRAVIRGRLELGDSMQYVGGLYTTSLDFAGAADPIKRRQSSRFVAAPNDPMAYRFYPSHIQEGWAVESTVYDRPPEEVFRPGDPNRPV